MPNRDKSNGTNNSNPIAPSTIVEQEVRYKRLSHRSMMLVNLKDFAKKFAKSDYLCIFVVRTGAVTYLKSTYDTLNKALSLVHFYLRSRDQFAKLGGNASFYTYYLNF